jgi:hypothetical protein
MALFEEALKWQRALDEGLQTRNNLIIRTSIAVCLWRQGRAREGFEMLEEVLEIGISEFGNKDGGIFILKFELGLMLDEEGSWMEALGLYFEAAAAAEPQYPPGSVDISYIWRAIGANNTARGELVKGEGILPGCTDCSQNCPQYISYCTLKYRGDVHRRFGNLLNVSS